LIFRNQPGQPIFVLFRGYGPTGVRHGASLYGVPEDAVEDILGAGIDGNGADLPEQGSYSVRSFC